MSHLYIHIPFCASRCGYCDFVTSSDLSAREAYVNALINELELLYHRYPMPLKTLYIGGGTPSVLSETSFYKLFNTVAKTFGNISDECTVEVNPESTSDTLISTLKDLGVNRISMGMQAVQPTLLSYLDRTSHYKQVYNGVDMLHKHGITNYNIDMIYGIPHQTLSDIDETLSALLTLMPNHISAYALKVEPDTPMANRIQRGDYTLPHDDEYADFLDRIITVLEERGTMRYEVSNFAKVGFESKHNSAYWQGANTLGLGLGSVYKLKHTRFENVQILDDYFNLVNSATLPIDDEKTQIMTLKEEQYEYLIVNFRLTKGVDTAVFNHRFNCDFEVEYRTWILKYIQHGVLEKTPYGYRLNHKGLNISNYILSDL